MRRAAAHTFGRGTGSGRHWVLTVISAAEADARRSPSAGGRRASKRLPQEVHMASTNARTTTHTDRERALRGAARAVGAVFLIVGILGFVPGVTSHVGSMEFAGHDSPSELLHVFQVSVLHNLVHIAFGIAGLLMASRARSAFWYLVGGGAIYLLLALYGAVIEKGESANFVPVNRADDWLHLGLGIGMIALGLLLTPHNVERRIEANRGRTAPNPS
jgi:hypothetical protein